MSEDQPSQSDVQPDDAFKRSQLTEDGAVDAEGHAIHRVGVTEDEGTDDPVGGQQPGDPDSIRFSDRNLKVQVVPVTW